MTLQSIIDLISGAKTEISLGVIGIIVLLSLIQVSKININPWDKILGWFGDKLNSGIKKEVESVKAELKQHIEDSASEKLENTRRDILQFCNSCMSGHKHTQEQFTFVVKKCDWYETYIEEHKIKNGEITSAISEIRRIYSICIQKNSFLKESDEDE